MEKIIPTADGRLERIMGRGDDPIRQRGEKKLLREQQQRKDTGTEKSVIGEKRAKRRTRQC